MDQKAKFDRLLQELIANKNFNNVYLSKSMYSQIISEVKSAKSKKNFKNALDYRRLKRYDVILVGNETKLIAPLKNEPKIKYFVSSDQLFDILHNSHITTGHGGRNRMLKDLNERYKNVTAESIMLYMSLCPDCQQRTKGKGKNVLTNELNSRCQLDLIDLQSQPDDEYKFMLNYQDHQTKFTILRPLKTKTPLEVAEQLLDIFALIGAPSVLQCDNRAFASEVITALTNLWDGIKMVHGKPICSQNQDVRNMLFTWLSSNNTTKWSKGLKFVQLMKNRSVHSEVSQTPYEALFGTKMKLGLKSSNLGESINGIQTEENLEKLIDFQRNDSKNLLGNSEMTSDPLIDNQDVGQLEKTNGTTNSSCNYSGLANKNTEIDQENSCEFETKLIIKEETPEMSEDENKIELVTIKSEIISDTERYISTENKNEITIKTENISNNKEDITTENNGYQCTSCKKIFKFKSWLNKHIRSHTQEHPFECPLCPKKYSTSSNLIRHKLMHESKGRLSCDFCNKKFTRLDNLTVHKRIHTNDRSIQCEVCNKKFLHGYIFLQHMRNHSGNQRHKFNCCCYKSATREMEKVFYCDVCDKGFSRTNYMNAHKKRFHK